MNHRLTKEHEGLLSKANERGIAWVYPVVDGHQECVDLGYITLDRYGPLTGYMVLTDEGRAALSDIL